MDHAFEKTKKCMELSLEGFSIGLMEETEKTYEGTYIHQMFKDEQNGDDIQEIPNWFFGIKVKEREWYDQV